MERKPHWENVYTTKATDAVSWFQPRADLSLRLIGEAGPDLDDPILDVGGGASVLVDDLLARGHRCVSVLDLSGAALRAAQARMGDRAGAVTWIEGDITAVSLPEAGYALWHDRAVFHFLTEEADRAAYRAALRRALRPGGTVVIATFAADGPEKCSGLPVVRYTAEGLHAALGPGFEVCDVVPEVHATPFGTTQSFVYLRLRRREGRRAAVTTAHP